jgi:hypothetical protein
MAGLQFLHLQEDTTETDFLQCLHREADMETTEEEVVVEGEEEEDIEEIEEATIDTELDFPLLLTPKSLIRHIFLVPSLQGIGLTFLLSQICIIV